MTREGKEKVPTGADTRLITRADLYTVLVPNFLRLQHKGESFLLISIFF